jgi:hypothetical protein
VQVDGARCAGREEVLLQQRDPAERLGEAAGAHRLPGLHLAHTVVDPYVFGSLLDPSLFVRRSASCGCTPVLRIHGPSDPCVFGPPGSVIICTEIRKLWLYAVLRFQVRRIRMFLDLLGSVSQRYGSGSFNQQAKKVRKILIFYYFVTSFFTFKL